MELCAIILCVFKTHAEKLKANTDITIQDVEYLFTIMLRVCAIGYFFVLTLLFTISRKITLRSTKPIRDIINTANSITHNNLNARIPLPSRKERELCPQIFVLYINWLDHRYFLSHQITHAYYSLFCNELH